jgi:hypothetical protein
MNEMKSKQINPIVKPLPTPIQCEFDPVCDNPGKSPKWVCNKSLDERLQSCVYCYRFWMLAKNLEKGDL